MTIEFSRQRRLPPIRLSAASFAVAIFLPDASRWTLKAL